MAHWGEADVDARKSETFRPRKSKPSNVIATDMSPPPPPIQIQMRGAETEKETKAKRERERDRGGGGGIRGEGEGMDGRGDDRTTTSTAITLSIVMQWEMATHVYVSTHSQYLNNSGIKPFLVPFRPRLWRRQSR